MNATMLSVLNDDERFLVALTEPDELAPLGEDDAIELHARIRKARNKYTGLYRRRASARVAEKGGRGRARPANERAAIKAEAFEQALSRVSRRVAVLARQSATRLRGERIEMARAAKQGRGPDADGQASAQTATGRQVTGRQVTGRPVTGAKAGDRALRSPATEKRRASTKAAGARRQAKRDRRSAT
jgi:hypothetical protein